MSRISSAYAVHQKYWLPCPPPTVYGLNIPMRHFSRPQAHAETSLRVGTMLSEKSAQVLG